MDTPHACLRALERYGITLDLEELRALADRLVAGEGMLLRRSPDGQEIKVIDVGGVVAVVVFSPLSGNIVTFLPRENATTRGKRAYLKARGR